MLARFIDDIIRRKKFSDWRLSQEQFQFVKTVKSESRLGGLPSSSYSYNIEHNLGNSIAVVDFCNILCFYYYELINNDVGIINYPLSSIPKIQCQIETEGQPVKLFNGWTLENNIMDSYEVYPNLISLEPGDPLPEVVPEIYKYLNFQLKSKMLMETSGFLRSKIIGFNHTHDIILHAFLRVTLITPVNSPIKRI